MSIDEPDEYAEISRLMDEGDEQRDGGDELDTEHIEDD